MRKWKKGKKKNYSTPYLLTHKCVYCTTSNKKALQIEKQVYIERERKTIPLLLLLLSIAVTLPVWFLQTLLGTSSFNFIFSNNCLSFYFYILFYIYVLHFLSLSAIGSKLNTHCISVRPICQNDVIEHYAFSALSSAEHTPPPPPRNPTRPKHFFSYYILAAPWHFFTFLSN